MFLYFIFIINLFAPTDLDVLIKEYLNVKLLGYDKWEYEISSKLRAIDKVEIDHNKDFKLVRQFGYIPVSVYIKGVKQSATLTVKLNLYRRVLVAGRDIKAGEELKQADFDFRIVEVSQLNDEPLTELKHSKQAKMNIRRGVVLTRSNVVLTPDIDLGEVVEAYYHNGGVVISFPVIARQVGYIGERIKVATREGRQYTATVEFNNLVKIMD